MNVRRNAASPERSTARAERIGPRRRDGHDRVDRSADPPKEAIPDRAKSLEQIVLERLEAYVAALKGERPRDLYALIMPQLERPLIRVAMGLAEGRQSAAAEMLGIHRNTLRARIRELGLDQEFEPKPRR